jgi:hypothetical protein
MNAKNLSLLTQLVSRLGENVNLFEKAYSEQEKEQFDSAKLNILDIQNKINFILQDGLK